MANCLYTKGFVRTIVEYAPLAWMSADTSHYKHLNELQRRALGLIAHDTLLQSHSLRSKVTALCYPYKRHYLAGPQQLMDMPLPPQLQHPTSTHGYNTNNMPGTNLNSTTPCIALNQITCSGGFPMWHPGDMEHHYYQIRYCMSHGHDQISSLFGKRVVDDNAVASQN